MIGRGKTRIKRTDADCLVEGSVLRHCPRSSACQW